MRSVARRAGRSIAVITTDVGRGLGFVVRQDRGHLELVTNRHVIEDAATITSVAFVGVSSAPEFTDVAVTYADGAQDLAVVTVWLHPGESAQGVRRLKMVRRQRRAEDDARARVGDHSVVFGLREGAPDSDLERSVPLLDSTLERLEESNFERRLVAQFATVQDVAMRVPGLDGQTYLGLDISLVPGQSGGPVLDRHGRVLGVVTGTRNDEGDKGFAMPASAVERLVARVPARESGNLRKPSAALRSRLEERTSGAIAALESDGIHDARVFVSPARAHEIRKSVVEAIMNHEDGWFVAPFLDLLDEMIERAQGDGAEVLDRLESLAADVASGDSYRAMHLDSIASPRQAETFFYLFGSHYVVARTNGGLNRNGALRHAVENVLSFDSARLFVLASLPGRMEGGPWDVLQTHIYPAPQGWTATVGVASRASPGGLLQLRFSYEWGDWYLVDVQSTVTKR